MKTKLILLVSIAIFLGNTISAQPFKYIGAVKCKACHNVVTSGEQYNKWMKEPHAQAIKTLGNENIIPLEVALGTCRLSGEFQE